MRRGAFLGLFLSVLTLCLGLLAWGQIVSASAEIVGAVSEVSRISETIATSISEQQQDMERWTADLHQPVQRKMILEFAHRHVGQEARACQSLLDQLGRTRCRLHRILARRPKWPPIRFCIVSP